MAARSFLSAYVLVSVLNVIAVATGNISGEQMTKPLLMPLLAGWLLAETRRHWSAPLTWLLAGLTAAWVGDLVLLGSGDVALLLGMAAFLVTQMSYVIAFNRVRGLRFRRAILVPGPEPVRGVVSRHRMLVIPFALVLIGFAWLLWPEAGDLRVPVVLYGAALTVMVLAALNLVGRIPARPAWTTVGGAALFWVSDALIGVTVTGVLPGSSTMDAVIMATYTAGQGLIALGLVTGVNDLRLARSDQALTDSRNR
jgi:uncharacterized membrane protein YhhN